VECVLSLVSVACTTVSMFTVPRGCWRLEVPAIVKCFVMLGWLSGVIGRRTCDQAVVGPGRAAIKLPRSTQPSIPLGR